MVDETVPRRAGRALYGSVLRAVLGGIERTVRHRALAPGFRDLSGTHKHGRGLWIASRCTAPGSRASAFEFAARRSQNLGLSECAGIRSAVGIRPLSLPQRYSRLRARWRPFSKCWLFPARLRRDLFWAVFFRRPGEVRDGVSTRRARRHRLQWVVRSPAF